MKKLYIVQKYIFAESLDHARRLEPSRKPDEIFLDNKFREMMNEQIFREEPYKGVAGFKPNEKRT